MARIVEFKTSPELLSTGEWKWWSTRAIDLDWVATAEEHREGSTVITMAGGRSDFPIKIDYPTFLVMWRGKIDEVFAL